MYLTRILLIMSMLIITTGPSTTGAAILFLYFFFTLNLALFAIFLGSLAKHKVEPEETERGSEAQSLSSYYRSKPASFFFQCAE